MGVRCISLRTPRPHANMGGRTRGIETEPRLGTIQSFALIPPDTIRHPIRFYFDDEN